LVLICVVIFSLCLAVNAKTNAKIVKAEITLSENTKIEDLRKIFQEFNGLIKQFSNVSIVNGKEYTGFYVIPQNQDFDKICINYKRMYYTGLCKMILKLEQKIKEGKIKNKESILNTLEDMKARMKGFEANNRIEIKKLVLYGDNKKIDDFYELNKSKDVKLSKIIKSEVED
jgi:hypothetical protein